MLPFKEEGGDTPPAATQAPREEWVPSTYQARTGEGAAAGAAAPKAAAAPAAPGGLQPWGEDGTAADGGDGDAAGDDAPAAAAKKSFGRAKKRQLTVRW